MSAERLQLKSSKSVPNTPSTSPREPSKRCEVTPSGFSPCNGDSKDRKSKLYGFSAKDVAEEMTLMDAGLLRLIKASELEDGAWMKKDKVSGTVVGFILC